MRNQKLILILFINWILVIGNWSFTYAARPLNTEDCWPTTFRRSAIEFSVSAVSGRNNFGTNSVTTVFKYGLTDKLDIGIELPYLSSSSYDSAIKGMGDSLIKFKYNFIDIPEDYGICGILQHQVKTGDLTNGLGSDQNDITALFVYTKKLNDLLFHLNFGYTFDDEPIGQEMDDFIIYNFAFEKPLNEQIGLVAESLNTISTITHENASEVSVGFNYKYSENLFLDLGIGAGLNDNSSNTRMTTGLTYIFI